MGEMIGHLDLGGAINSYLAHLSQYGLEDDELDDEGGDGGPGLKAELAELIALVEGSPHRAPGYLNKHPRLASAIALSIQSEDPSLRLTRSVRMARLQRFVAVHGGFLLPRVFYDPEVEGGTEMVSMAEELDDVDLARCALYCYLHYYDLPDDLRRIGDSFEIGGRLFGRLLDAMGREIVAWPRMFNIDGLADAFQRNRRAIGRFPRQWFPRNHMLLESFLEARGSLPGMYLTRFAGIGHLYDDVVGGYDPARVTKYDLDGMDLGDVDLDFHERIGGGLAEIWKSKGKYFFDPSERQSFLGFMNYGVNNIDSGVVASVSYYLSGHFFLTLLVAAYNKNYLSGGEYAVMAEATELLDEALRMQRHVCSRIIVYSYPETDAARVRLQRFLDAGFLIHFDLGRSYSGQTAAQSNRRDDLECAYHYLYGGGLDVVSDCDVAWMIINSPQDLPLEAAGTDEMNEPAFHLHLLSFSDDEAFQLFETMTQENEEMAARASAFYASIPGYSMPILERWRDVWKKPSHELDLFLTATIERCRYTADKYMMKYYRKGDQLPSPDPAGGTPAPYGSPKHFVNTPSGPGGLRAVSVSDEAGLAVVARMAMDATPRHRSVPMVPPVTSYGVALGMLPPSLMATSFVPALPFCSV